ncbi:MAG: hypothetical protein GY802_01750 [Gammaproteobacteria bacterium]|nr:hypothetical protein [Gammaproteobacteria bacterium]MCP4386992.1 hypothetical protein [Gammaproteobacteria bacterium]MCP5093581.1 hypothetical protein [Gammaproteobacteria bacterium]
MKPWSIAVALVAAFTVQGPAQSADLGALAATLEGDARTACEVILCLSTGQRPGECGSPLSYFFSIRASKPHKTIRKRVNFLKLCPDGGGVPDSYRRILATSGQTCDMSSLLKYLNYPANYSGTPATRTIPAHCHDYATHEWTYALALPERQQWCAMIKVDNEISPERRCIYRWVDPRLETPTLTDAEVRDLIDREWRNQRDMYADGG